MSSTPKRPDASHGPANTSAPGAGPDSGPRLIHMPTAEHLHEFGHVDNLVHIAHPPRPSHEDALPPPPMDRRDKLALHERLVRLRRRCFHERHIHQYWQGDTLFRTAGNRRIGPDELFLDLVIVGGIAALGHELRVQFAGWLEVEKFFLLFGAMYTSWRAVVLLWNLWGVSSDLLDKAGIYLVFTALAFISLGSHGAFDDLSVRPFVAVAAFLATAIPSTINFIWGMREPLIKPIGRRPRQVTFLTLLQTAAALPYLAAAFVQSESELPSRILYWLGFGLGAFAFVFGATIYKHAFHIEETNPTTARFAVSIELMVEKYDVLTMIVLGESVLGVLFEGAELVIKEGVKLGDLFSAAAMSTSMLYALQTLYNNVDGTISRGGKHAIRYHRWYGLSWSIIHIPYHASLILFATGLGISLRDIAVPPVHENAEDHMIMSMTSTVLRTGEGKELDGFDTKARWLFSAGWGVAILLSGLLGAMHLPGPRAATKPWRLLMRSLIVIPLTFGMPFTKVSAIGFLAVFTAALVFIAVVEYICVQMDRMGFFRSEVSLNSSSMDTQGKASMGTQGKESGFDVDMEDGEFDDSDDVSDADDIDRLKEQRSRLEPPEGQQINNDLERGMSLRQQLPSSPDQVVLPEVAEAGQDEQGQAVLRQRLCRSHTKRLVALSKKRSELDLHAGV